MLPRRTSGAPPLLAVLRDSTARLFAFWAELFALRRTRGGDRRTVAAEERRLMLDTSILSGWKQSSSSLRQRSPRFMVGNLGRHCCGDLRPEANTVRAGAQSVVSAGGVGPHIALRFIGEIRIERVFAGEGSGGRPAFGVAPAPSRLRATTGVQRAGVPGDPPRGVGICNGAMESSIACADGEAPSRGPRGASLPVTLGDVHVNVGNSPSPESELVELRHVGNTMSRISLSDPDDVPRSIGLLLRDLLGRRSSAMPRAKRLLRSSSSVESQLD